MIQHKLFYKVLNFNKINSLQIYTMLNNFIKINKYQQKQTYNFIKILEL